MALRNLSLKDVSNLTKINYEMIRRYAQGIATPRSNNLTLIAKTLNVEESWLVFGSNQMIESKHDPNKSTSYSIEVLDLTASAGEGFINSDIQEVIKLIEFDKSQAKSLFNGISSDKIKVINIRGDSMQGTFESGDSVYVDISKQSFEGDGIYVFSFGKGIYIKRLQLIKDVIRVKSDNALYDPWEITEKEIYKLHIHGKVIFSQSMLLRKHG